MRKRGEKTGGLIKSLIDKKPFKLDEKMRKKTDHSMFVC